MKHLLKGIRPCVQLPSDILWCKCRCGWGSATVYFAEQFPNSRVVGFSNSRSQKEYIESLAAKRDIQNVEVITGDIADYEFEPEQFDRVVSVEVRAATLLCLRF